MTDDVESVLYKRASIRVTTQRFVIANDGSYRLSDLVSAEVGHETPRFADWMFSAVFVGLLVAAINGAYLLLGIPGTNTETLPESPSLVWRHAEDLVVLIYGGAGIAVLGAVLGTLTALIWGRYVVRVKTKSDESEIIFGSRDRKLVEGSVKAINKAIGSASSPS